MKFKIGGIYKTSAGYRVKYVYELKEVAYPNLFIGVDDCRLTIRTDSNGIHHCGCICHLIEPTVDWALIPSAFKYATRSADNELIVWENKPNIVANNWYCFSGMRMFIHPRYVSPWDGDWHESLVKREEN